MDIRAEMAAIVKGVIEELIHQPIQVLTLNSSKATGEVTGRFRAAQLVYDYGIKGEDVTYKPLGAGGAQARKDSGGDLEGFHRWRRDSRAYLQGINGWSAERVDSYLEAAVRMDAPRPGQKNCGTGYRCGDTCISRAKRCVLQGAAMALGRLGALASGQPVAVTRLGKELHGPNDRAGQLLQRRDALIAEGVAMLGRQRDDGGGTLMEHPTPEAMKTLEALGRRVRDIDRELQTASGEDPEKRRWQKGTPGLETPKGGFHPAMPDSPGRVRFREQLIQDALAQGSTVGKGSGGRPVAIVMMGGPASGKSSLLSRVMSDQTGYVKVDPDEMKGRLPEFALAVANSDRLGAARAHEESSTAIADVLKKRAIEGRYNVMLDGTGKNGPKYEAMVQALVDQGYEIRVIMPHISVEEGVKAADKRAHRTGRYVPLEFIRQAYQAIPHNFERVARLADTAVLADAEPDRLGSRPMTTIQRWEGGRIVEEDKAKSSAYKKAFFGGKK